MVFSPQNFMAPFIFYILITLFMIPTTTQIQFNEKASISMLISAKGLDFAKNILTNQAISSLTPLQLPQIEKSKKIPLVGDVGFILSDITLYHVDVPSSIVKPGDLGITIVASGATANLSMNWSYSYSSWFVEISDNGSASVQVEGMEVGLTLGLENREGTLELSLLDSGCTVEEISITLDGGASWLYQGLVDAFKDQIRSNVESSIVKKMKDGISKLDASLKTLPKEIPIDNIAALNITFVDQPILSESYIGLDISGQFTAASNTTISNYYSKKSVSQTSTSCNGSSKMLEISLDESVFNSGSLIYFKAGLQHWVVDEVPDQALLNTAAWKYIIPKLYRQYPDRDMCLNISLTSPPLLKISSTNDIDTTIFSDVILGVLVDNETISVACISLVVNGSISVSINGNNLAGNVKLDEFTMALKWSEIGNFHMFLIQSVMRTFLRVIALPFINLRLREGLPLPILQGFTLQDAEILLTNSRIVICSDVVYTDAYDDLKQLPRYSF